MDLPRVKTSGQGPSKTVVGFTLDTSPSSVLRTDSPASSDDRRGEGLESPLSALKRELSMPQLNHALPTLPKLKLGLGRGKGIGRSKSQGNLLATRPAEVPEHPKQRSATSSPHAASSGGSEPVRIPFEFSRRRTFSVDFDAPHDDDEIATTPVISAASSLIGHHLADRAANDTAGGASSALPPLPPPHRPSSLAGGSAAGSPPPGGGRGSGGDGSAPGRQFSVQSAKDLFAAQADAVMAHAQVQTLQSALKKEQEEATRLREALQHMTAERDRLLAELAQGGTDGTLPVFLMDSPAPPPSPQAPRPPALPHRRGSDGLRSALRFR